MTICKYFGVRTSTRESGVKCQECKKDDPETFKNCTQETNILMSTSVSIDAKGNTVIAPPAGKVSDDELLVEMRKGE